MRIFDGNSYLLDKEDLNRSGIEKWENGEWITVWDTKFSQRETYNANWIIVYKKNGGVQAIKSRSLYLPDFLYREKKLKKLLSIIRK